MSQIYKSVSSSPSVPTTFDTDVDSPAVPAANILNVFGRQSSVNNINGIQTDGSSGSNTLTVQLTNRATGTVTTTNATPTTIITFPLAAVPTVYSIDGLVSGYDSTNSSGCGFFFVACMRTNGTTAVEVGSEITSSFDDTPDMTTNVLVTASGNNMLIQVQGVAATTIDWLAQFNYIRVS